MAEGIAGALKLAKCSETKQMEIISRDEAEIIEGTGGAGEMAFLQPSEPFNMAAVLVAGRRWE